MSANIYEQTKEIGIARAIGFTKHKIILMYGYEAFVLVASSSVMGILIGLCIGYSMTM